MKAWLNNRFEAAITERFPEVVQGKVGQRQLFVLPSLNGVLWLVLALVIWLTGINYQNGLVLIIAYLMGSIWLAAMWLCYRNLHGLQYHISAIRHAEAGEQAEVDIAFSSKRTRYDIAVRCTTGEWRYTDVSSDSQGSVRVLVDLPHRGVFRLPALRLETRQPFDLAVVWSQLRLSCELLAYPVAKSAMVNAIPTDASASEHERPSNRGDVDGLTEWQAGQETKHLRWQHYLLTGEARLLHFAEPAGAQSQMIALDQYSHLGLEAALSAMAERANHYHEHEIAFGLSLGNQTIDINAGAQHLSNVREALARYGH